MNSYGPEQTPGPEPGPDSDRGSGLVTIATLTRPRGNKGELAALSQSSFPERFSQLTRVFVDGQPFPVESVWWHGDKLIFKFAGIDSISSAEPLSGKDVEIPAAERIPLPPGEYYLTDLVGLTVFDRGEEIGPVTGWQELPGQVLIEAGELEFPKQMIDSVDFAARRIEVTLPEGLRELNG